jgi:hypothetical protein
MSSRVPRYEYDDGTHYLGDMVYFRTPWNTVERGEVVRVYNTRSAYHVEYNGERYHVDCHEIWRTLEDAEQASY